MAGRTHACGRTRAEPGGRVEDEREHILELNNPTRGGRETCRVLRWATKTSGRLIVACHQVFRHRQDDSGTRERRILTLLIGLETSN